MVTVDRLGVGFIGSGFIARFAAQGWTGVRGADVNIDGVLFGSILLVDYI